MTPVNLEDIYSTSLQDSGQKVSECSDRKTKTKVSDTSQKIGLLELNYYDNHESLDYKHKNKGKKKS